MVLSKRQRFLIFFWLFLAISILYLKVLPLGQATYELTYHTLSRPFGGKGFIGHLTPSERVTQNTGDAAVMTGDPVYFSVFTPRTFSEAKVTITYHDELEQNTPIIEAGVLVDNLVWRYKTAPLENRTLDNLNTWSKVVDGTTALYQRQSNFASVEDFVSAANQTPEQICNGKPLNTCLALYNPPALNFLQSKALGLVQSFKPWSFALKGAHQFYFTAPAGQPLKFSFDFSDLNLDKRSDPIYLIVYRGDQIVCQKIIEDNFGGEGEGVSRRFSETFTCDASPNAETFDASPNAEAFDASPNAETLKLEVKGSNDMIIGGITEAPSALNFVGRVYPVAAEKTPLTFWTDRDVISLTTANPASRQKVDFSDRQFSLAEPYQRYEFSNHKPGLKSITLYKEDVILEAGGVFALAPENFFNPDFETLGRYFTLDDQINYILSDYQTPRFSDNGLKEASATFDTQHAYRENGKYSFMISVPGLAPEDNGRLIIEAIKVEFTGRSLWEKLADFF